MGELSLSNSDRCDMGFRVSTQISCVIRHSVSFHYFFFSKKWLIVSEGLQSLDNLSFLDLSGNLIGRLVLVIFTCTCASVLGLFNCVCFEIIKHLVSRYRIGCDFQFTGFLALIHYDRCKI